MKEDRTISDRNHIEKTSTSNKDNLGALMNEEKRHIQAPRLSHPDSEQG
jgi:hypothetical protein